MNSNSKSKFLTYARTLQDVRNIVFCARCGSTRVDQVSTSEIACLDCENSLDFDTQKFGIARNGNYASDMKDALALQEERLTMQGEHPHQNHSTSEEKQK
jgi:late competence protein required for DNA uptake (superfamily II DNA/RNA helicase)